MRYAQLFSKTKFEAPADADSVNAKYLSQGGFVSRQTAGIYNFLPLGLRVLVKIQKIIREEMNALGAHELLMPALTQLDSYIQTGRQDIDVLLHLEGHGGKYVLNPTHEEVVTPLIAQFAFSYRDFPIAVYQIQNKFRNEARSKSGVLRGREFNMKDLYSFHANETDLDAYYERVKAAYHKIYARLGIGDLTYVAFASGGSFSKYSHEFQTICEVGEDLIYLCEKCRIGINKEIIDEQKVCPECGSDKLVEKKSIEVGNIFKLRTRFSDAFGFTYADEKGEKKPVEMGCYGIGPSRVMGTIVEVSHDDKGIIWPEAVAPFKVHIVTLGNQEEVLEGANELYMQMQNLGIEVMIDDRDESAGKKLTDADLLGIPYRVVVSARSLKAGGVEVKKRCEAESKVMSVKELVEAL